MRVNAADRDFRSEGCAFMGVVGRRKLLPGPPGTTGIPPVNALSSGGEDTPHGKQICCPATVSSEACIDWRRVALLGTGGRALPVVWGILGWGKPDAEAVMAGGCERVPHRQPAVSRQGRSSLHPQIDKIIKYFLRSAFGRLKAKVRFRGVLQGAPLSSSRRKTTTPQR
jgi:hypothetical protein